MLSSRTIRRVSCLSLWSKLEITLSQNDHFFGNGLSSSSFLFPPNIKHDVLDISVLCVLGAIVFEGIGVVRTGMARTQLGDCGFAAGAV